MHRPALFGADGQAPDQRHDRQRLAGGHRVRRPSGFLRGLNNAGRWCRSAACMRCRPRRPNWPRCCGSATRNCAMFPNASPIAAGVRNFTDPRVLTVFFGALNREPDWRLADRRDQRGRRAGRRPAAVPGGARRGVLPGAGNPEQKLHAAVRLRHLYGSARHFGNFADAAGRHAVQSRQIRPEIHRGGRLPGRRAGQFCGLSQQYRAWRNRADLQ